jgi:hypothetical protein
MAAAVLGSNRSNLYRKDNPSWAISNVTETPRVPCGRIRFAGGVCLSWLIGLPRRAGRRLHAMNDAESRWWHWLVAEGRGGLTRQYRDARFEALRGDPTLRRTEPTDPGPAAPWPGCPCGGNPR